MTSASASTLPAMGFFDLPYWLQGRIYDELFPEGDAVDFSTMISRPAVGPVTRSRNTIAPRNSSFQFLRCSTRTAREGARLLYGRARLIVNRRCLRTFLSWLRKIGPQNCRYLKYLHLDLQGPKISKDALASSNAQTTVDRRPLDTRVCHSVEQLAHHLRQTSFQLIELLMEDHLFEKIEPSLLNMKAATIVIWESTKIRHDSAVFKKMWATEVIVMGSHSKTMKDCRTATLTARRAKGFYYPVTFRNNFGGPMDIFSELPAEIRYMVYRLLL